jgi:hypothetical protein
MAGAMAHQIAGDIAATHKPLYNCRRLVREAKRLFLSWKDPTNWRASGISMAVPLALTLPVPFEHVLRMNALPRGGFGPDVLGHPKFLTG